MLVPLILALTLATAVFCSSVAAASITNGNFESGLDGWTVIDKPDSEGTWTTYSSATLPISAQTGVAPESGSAVVSDQMEPMSSVLYQDVKLDPEATHTLSLKYWYENSDTSWTIPDPLDFEHSGGPRQFIRIEVARPDADPFSPDSASILKTIFSPSGSDPRSTGWTTFSADLSDFAGQTVRLRVINTSNSAGMIFGLDDIAIATSPLPPSVLGITKVSPKSYTLKKGKQGITVNYSLTRDAFVVVVVQKSAAGRRSGKKCAKPSKKNKKGKRCTRWLNLSSHSFAGTAGANTFKFDGKVHRKRASAGNYRLTLTPNTTLTHGLTSTVSFKVKPAKKKRK